MAALEFAIVFTALFLLLYGIVTFGAVFYTQQAVSRAAQDAARAISFLPTALTANDPRITAVVHDSLARSLVTPLSSGGSFSSRRVWIASKVSVSVALPGTAAKVIVSYPYGQNQLLPALPLQGFSGWFPTTLTGQATVAIRS